jgi:hypothetical protein
VASPATRVGVAASRVASSRTAVCAAVRAARLTSPSILRITPSTTVASFSHRTNPSRQVGVGEVGDGETVDPSPIGGEPAVALAAGEDGDVGGDGDGEVPACAAHVRSETVAMLVSHRATYLPLSIAPPRDDSLGGILSRRPPPDPVPCCPTPPAPLVGAVRMKHGDVALARTDEPAEQQPPRRFRQAGQRPLAVPHPPPIRAFHPTPPSAPSSSSRETRPP